MIKKRLFYYLKIWWLMSRNSFVTAFYQKAPFVFFLFGKVARFTFYLIFLVFIIKGVNNIVGYTQNQAVFFFLTYNLIDVFGQFLYREVYRFRPLIVSGDFDLVLVKPINALFRVLMGGADAIDLVTIPPLILAICYIGSMLAPSVLQIFLFLALLANGLLIITSIYIFVLGFGIITFEIDHLVMIFRDLISLGRWPVDIYRQPIRFILLYIVPIGVMITLPAKALMGLVTPVGAAVSFSLGALSLFLSLKFWHFALKRYTSASS